MSKLLLVRHGETGLNKDSRFQGHIDVELNETGMRQAERLRDRLSNERIDTVYSSDLRRALVTAEVIASKHQVDIITSAELREISYGELEGLTFKEINQLYPEVAESIATASSKLDFPGGESFKEFIERLSKFAHRLKHASEETILVVAHSAPLRLLVCLLLGIELNHWRQFRLDLASLSILETYSQGVFLHLLNDICHLEQ